MANVYDTTVQAISSVTSIDPAEIAPEKHIFEDLKIDSLDFLDITFEIDRHLSIKLPIEEWMAAGSGAADERFLIKNFVAFVSEVLTAQEAKVVA
jgi:acyl carrier protein